LVPGVVLAPAAAGACLVDVLGYRARLRARPGQPPGPAMVCLRPEDLRLVADPAAGIAVRVRRATYQGGRTAVELETGAPPGVRLQLLLPPVDAPPTGTSVRVAVDDGWVIPPGA
jgi:iron(III) transport system ATP-binding protein